MQHATEIEFTNHLMFNAVLTENEDLCARLIGAVLGTTVERIEFLEDEATVQPTVDGRGARLDVLALIDGEFVDVEMQMGSEPDIARRCRFYHSAIATRYMPKGTGYSDVPRSIVIFFCLSDPLGMGRARYELRTTCPSIPNLTVDDGATTVLLNAQAWQMETNPEVAGLLNYALTGTIDDGLAGDIARAVKNKNLDRRWVRASMGVMTYEHELTVLNHALEEKRAEVEAAQAEVEAAQAEVEAAQAEVEAARIDAETAHAELQKERRVKELSKRLHDAGRIGEYFAALDDDSLMDSLLKEFGLAQ